MEFVKRQYRLAWDFFKQSLAKPFLGCALAFLALCVVSGLLFGRFIHQAEAVVGQFLSDLEQSGLLKENGTIGLPALLGNNLRATLAAAALGIVPFVYLTVLPLAMNAAVIGAVLAASSAMGAGLWQMVVLGLLPHGVFELPAILLGMAMGLRLCAGLSAAIRKKPGVPRPEELLPQLVRQYVCFCLPLLTVAAVVETFVTPVLMGLAL